MGSHHTARRCGVVFLLVIALKWVSAGEYKELDSVVEQAVAQLLREEAVLTSRLEAGVDRRVTDFTALAPPMLGADSIPLMSSSLTRLCKAINRIYYFAKRFNTSTDINEILSTPTAKAKNIKNPFDIGKCNWMLSGFRTFDGSCNNRLHPSWGKAFMPTARELPPAYDPELVGEKYVRVGLPRRTAVDGSPLPSARLISNVVHPPSASPLGSATTTLYTNFGQSLSHDMSDTPMEAGALGAKLGCCNQTKPTSRCFNIDIPEDDEFFHDFGRTCMGFVRSAEATDEFCATGVREQVNIVSSFVDATQIYGHNEEHAALLRDGDGLLKSSDPNHLPLQAHPNIKALRHGINYFMAGDEKNGEFPGLVGITTMLQREHNRIAKEIIKMRNIPFRGQIPEGDGESTFFRARKIVIALLQHIVYAEYLPVTLGPEYMAKYKLNPSASGYFEGYNPDVNPTVTNVVASAAMRFGHSMIRNTYSVVDPQFISTDAVLRLKRLYWRDNFYLLFENGFQRGVLVDDSEKCDRHMSIDLKNHMFETKPGNGLDLAALNVQRGRDHGLPSYNEYRRLVGLSAATEWTAHPVKGFTDMTEEVVNKFKAVYSSPEDVDVWSGGVSETQVPGGQVGRLFAELLGRQFQRLKEGDFYWYENKCNGFTLDQLSEIRKYSLAKMMCNTFPLDKIQPKAFLLSSVPGNARVPCNSLPDINLHGWRL